ncbi:glucose 1-dehydrogenase [Roseomonas hellenica]|uniref:Glucose 1-dehydrogenase n=2 Tax=Plastoroseomonas hellenica TaxID=2687306 RepID=A0ABS5F250_9PROT|nr:glucose 1-dehydrogenase [Plastoroseomonas hellenica]
MSMDFRNKVALITGGAGGIGRATSLAFAKAGARVVVVDRDAPGGEETARQVRDAGGEARFVAADVTRSAEVRGYAQAALDAFGRIDCFFNNAGIEGKVAPTAEYDEDLFDTVIAVNLKGVFLGLRHVLPVMLRQGGGAIVNTASTAGVAGSPGLSAYVASKHGVIGLTRTAASEYGHAGIRINAVCPGPTDTRMIRSLEEQSAPGGSNSVRERYQSAIPIGRYAVPEEIANLVLFLSSDLAASITGGQYLIDGGRLASPAALRSFAAR